jgi:hypothetical protein
MAAVISSPGEEANAAAATNAASAAATDANKPPNKLPASSTSSENYQTMIANSTVLSDILSNRDTINYDSATAAVKGLKIAKVRYIVKPL